MLIAFIDDDVHVNHFNHLMTVMVLWCYYYNIWSTHQISAISTIWLPRITYNRCNYPWQFIRSHHLITDVASYVTKEMSFQIARISNLIFIIKFLSRTAVCEQNVCTQLKFSCMLLAKQRWIVQCYLIFLAAKYLIYSQPLNLSAYQNHDHWHEAIFSYS